MIVFNTQQEHESLKFFAMWIQFPNFRKWLLCNMCQEKLSNEVRFMTV